MRSSSAKATASAVLYRAALALALAMVLGLSVASSWAQAPPPPSFAPDQLDKLVSRIALYPDPLLAQILAAATYPDQIPDAAKYADEHHYLSGDDLAKAIQDDMVPWDASVQALLPFPSVLEMMSGDMKWTTDLGNAFLAQQQDVMDAVQRMRQKAKDFGYLKTNGQIVVSGGPYIAIAPVNPALICVPYYDPLVVFAAPRPGFFVGGAISFGYNVRIGVGFAPWGWGSSRFDWGGHRLFIADRPWGRTWVNRAAYAHPYANFHRYSGPARLEHHTLTPRSAPERDAARRGRPRVEEHHR